MKYWIRISKLKKSKKGYLEFLNGKIVKLSDSQAKEFDERIKQWQTEAIMCGRESDTLGTVGDAYTLPPPIGKGTSLKQEPRHYETKPHDCVAPTFHYRKGFEPKPNKQES